MTNWPAMMTNRPKIIYCKFVFYLTIDKNCPNTNGSCELLRSLGVYRPSIVFTHFIFQSSLQEVLKGLKQTCCKFLTKCYYFNDYWQSNMVLASRFLYKVGHCCSTISSDDLVYYLTFTRLIICSLVYISYV